MRSAENICPPPFEKLEIREENKNLFLD